MAVFKQLDNAAAVAEQLGCADADAAMQLLGDEATLLHGLTALGWAAAGDYAVVRVAPVLSRFICGHEAPIRSFLHGETPLRDIYCALIVHLGDEGFELDPEQLLVTLRPHERVCHERLLEQLRQLPLRDVVHFLGFGLARGEYEQELADYLVANGLAGEVRLYGCDPYVDFSGSGIEEWTPSAAGEQQFDLILARWVLHHLEPAFRWQAFTPVARHLAPGGCLLILEEGDFRAADERRFADQLMALVLSSIDVINTLTFVAEWHEKSAESADAYYLQHLSADEIAVIESGFGFPFERQIIETGPGVFGQTIFAYRRLSR